jgi:hypothetical protein
MYLNLFIFMKQCILYLGITFAVMEVTLVLKDIIFYCFFGLINMD